LLIVVNVPMPALGVVRPTIVVDVTVFLLVIVASIDLLSVVPANVYGYAAIMGCRRRDPEWSVHRRIRAAHAGSELLWLRGVLRRPSASRQPSASRVDVTVLTASLACENPRWNARLLSEEWFDAQRYPQITYHNDVRNLRPAL
jgi:YceI-like domain/Protein of unknown function (DUF1097)